MNFSKFGKASNLFYRLYFTYEILYQTILVNYIIRSTQSAKYRYSFKLNYILLKFKPTSSPAIFLRVMYVN